jgi:hypothetical protein
MLFLSGDFQNLLIPTLPAIGELHASLAELGPDGHNAQ